MSGCKLRAPVLISADSSSLLNANHSPLSGFWMLVDTATKSTASALSGAVLMGFWELRSGGWQAYKRELVLRTGPLSHHSTQLLACRIRDPNFRSASAVCAHARAALYIHYLLLTTSSLVPMLHTYLPLLTPDFRRAYPSLTTTCYLLLATCTASTVILYD